MIIAIPHPFRGYLTQFLTYTAISFPPSKMPLNSCFIGVKNPGSYLMQVNGPEVEWMALKPQSVEGGLLCGSIWNPSGCFLVGQRWSLERDGKL